MKLIKQLNATKIQEDASGGGGVAAGAVAGFATPLFASLVKRSRPRKNKVTVSRMDSKPSDQPSLIKQFIAAREAAGLTPAGLSLLEKHPNVEDTIDRLKNMERRDTTEQQDTVSFGLEDDNGQTVRVTVKQEQAEDFEHALQGMLNRDESEGDEPMDIAEMLFRLKDSFDIVDITWPDVPEDEEQPVTPPEEGDEQPPEGSELDVPLDDQQPSPEDGGDQTANLLAQVIDMMRADAEARKAEAKAREAEARGKEADAVLAQTMSRVKREEEFLDMERAQKEQKAQEREVKRLAQLAQWKRETQGDDEMEDPDFAAALPRTASVENEERATAQPKGHGLRGKVAPVDVAQFIINRIK